MLLPFTVQLLTSECTVWHSLDLQNVYLRLNTVKTQHLFSALRNKPVNPRFWKLVHLSVNNTCFLADVVDGGDLHRQAYFPFAVILVGAGLSVNWEHSPSCCGSPAQGHTGRWILASWCVIRIRIRMLSQPTQTEVNEHVCLQSGIPLSQPAVRSLCREIAEDDPLLQISKSFFSPFYFIFLVCFSGVFCLFR